MVTTMGNMYYLITIAKREYGEDFIEFFYESGVHSLTAALCEGTAQKKTLDLLDEDDDVQNVYHNWDE